MLVLEKFERSTLGKSFCVFAIFNPCRCVGFFQNELLQGELSNRKFAFLFRLLALSSQHVHSVHRPSVYARLHFRVQNFFSILLGSLLSDQLGGVKLKREKSRNHFRLNYFPSFLNFCSSQLFVRRGLVHPHAQRGRKF